MSNLLRTYLFTIVWTLLRSSCGFAEFVPICTEMGTTLAPQDQARIAREIDELRMLLTTQTLGSEGLAVIQRATKLDPFSIVTDPDQAVEIGERMLHRVDAQPVRELLDSLPDHVLWSLYLMTGYYALSTHTPSHRQMVDTVATWLTLGDISGRRVRDVGLGLANLGTAVMLKDPNCTVSMLDITSNALGFAGILASKVSDVLPGRVLDPTSEQIGRFDIMRGSGVDATRFPPNTFDALSSVLTLFAIPRQMQDKAVSIWAASLVKGGILVLVDPLDTVNQPAKRRQFILDVAREAAKANPNLRVVDIVIFVLQNASMLSDIPFRTPREQRAILARHGLVPIDDGGKAVFTDNAYLSVYAKP